jgi:hydroxymethylpyrimidine/phosphomethylpyrimidine kinase
MVFAHALLSIARTQWLIVNILERILWMLMQKYDAVLTIGGSDSSGGAGIQEDLRVFSNIGIHGCSVVTCITAQNTQRIDSIYPIPQGEVERQLESVVSDIELKAAKTGLLYSGEIVGSVSKGLRDSGFPIIVDPVMTASVGKRLHTDDFLDAFKKDIVPLAHVITPNSDEASRLSGIDIEGLEDCRRALDVIQKLGAENVIVTGIQVDDEVVDLLYDGRRHTEFRGFRYEGVVHGSGCAFSSALTAFIGKGYGLEESIEESRKLVGLAYATNFQVGKGIPLLNTHYKIDRYAVMKELESSIEELSVMLKTNMIPEVGINFGYALPGATSPEEVCAIRGRLTRKGKGLHFDSVDFGASKHVAAVILTVMRFDPRLRSSANLKYDEEIVNRANSAGMTVESFRREDEPDGRSTMVWGVEDVVRRTKSIPDLIFDLGSRGKEPMIRVLGRNPGDVVRKVKMLAV